MADSNPRAWIASDVELVDDATALAKLADHSFDLRRVALVAEDADLGSNIDLAAGGPFPADGEAVIQLTRRRPGHLGVSIEKANGPLLIVSENWMPGWRTEPPLPLFRTDLTLIGVLLPAADIEFDLIYQPSSVRLGLAISGITLLLVGLIAGLRWRHTRQRERGS